MRSVPLSLLLKNSTNLDEEFDSNQPLASLDDWTVVGHLNEKDLAFSKSAGFFLLSPDASPEPCLCFQNEALTQIVPPLLIKVKRVESAPFLLWDGTDLKEVGNLEFQMNQLLWITT